jgi:hypothetical protein
MAYAQGTTVPVEKTLEEIRRLLKRHGCEGFGQIEQGGRMAIQFILEGLQYRFVVDEPLEEEWKQKYYDDRYANTSLSATAIRNRMARMDWQRELDAEVRRRWRARLLWLKATLEFAESDGRDVIRQALLSQLVLPGGQTMDDWAAKALPEAYQTGGMPPLLPGG